MQKAPTRSSSALPASRTGDVHAASIARAASAWTASFSKSHRRCRPLPNDPVARDHDMGDTGGVLGENHLVRRIVDRDPVHRMSVEEHDVRRAAGRQRADRVKARGPRPADSRGMDDFGRGQPSLVVGSAHAGDHRSVAHRLVHVEVVAAIRAVGADGEVHAALEHSPRVGDARSQPHVRARIMSHRRALVSQQSQIIIIEPDTMREREIRPCQAESIDMPGDRTAPALASPRRPGFSTPPHGFEAARRIPAPKRRSP